MGDSECEILTASSGQVYKMKKVGNDLRRVKIQINEDEYSNDFPTFENKQNFVEAVLPFLGNVRELILFYHCTDIGLEIVSDTCKQLGQLTLINCPGVTIEGLERVLTNLPNLGLDLMNCYQVNRTEIENLEDRFSDANISFSDDTENNADNSADDDGSDSDEDSLKDAYDDYKQQHSDESD